MPVNIQSQRSIPEFISELRAAAVIWDEREVRGNDFARGKGATCRDIARKLELYGRWASERQRNYAERLIQWSRSGQERTAVQAMSTYQAEGFRAHVDRFCASGADHRR